MKFIKLARLEERAKGYDYYMDNRVRSFSKIDDTHYKGRVTGNTKGVRNVTLDLEKGNGVICRHKVALYLTFFPEALEYAKEEKYNYEEKKELQRIQAEQRKEEKLNAIKGYIFGASRFELKILLEDILDKFSDQIADYIHLYYIEDDPKYIWRRIRWKKEAQIERRKY